MVNIVNNVITMCGASWGTGNIKGNTVKYIAGLTIRLYAPNQGIMNKIKQSSNKY